MDHGPRLLCGGKAPLGLRGNNVARADGGDMPPEATRGTGEREDIPPLDNREDGQWRHVN